MSPVSDYVDLEIRILGLDTGRYPVEITLNSDQQFERGYMAPQAWVSTADPLADGLALFEWLFGDKTLLAGWSEARGRHPRRRVRLRIDPAAAELHAIPWELLRDPETASGDVAADSATPFSRYVAGKWHPGNPTFKRPLRMLVVVSNPDLANSKFKSLAPIDVDGEQALIRSATQAFAEKVDVTMLPQPATLSAIENELRSGYHILHVIAHGLHARSGDSSALVLADESNSVDLVDAEALALMLARQLENDAIDRDNQLRLVYLSSCQTAKSTPQSAFRGVANRLVEIGIPAVVAMQDDVTVETAQRFSGHFYERVLDHGLVDVAANEARSHVLTKRRQDAALPTLYLRLRSGALFGKRGRVSSSQQDRFWPFLLDRAESKQLIPFLGPRLLGGLLHTPESAAKILAEHYKYPLADRENLARVAQYISLTSRSSLHDRYMRVMRKALFDNLGQKLTPEIRQEYRSLNFSQTVERLNWSEQILSFREDEIHHLLAALELPLYITTNFDNFLEQALNHNGVAPRRVTPRWHPDPASPYYLLSPPGMSPAEPVVFHLNGFDEAPEHLVLSEDEHLAHLIRLYQEQDATVPRSVFQALSQHSYMFLGFRLTDWEFRVILQGLLRRIASSGQRQRIHVGVQLEPGEGPSQKEAIAYLRDYLAGFDIHIYWGTPEQFISELLTRLDELTLEEESDFF